MKQTGFLLLLFLAACGGSKKMSTAPVAATMAKQYYALRIYHFTSGEQAALIDNFLKNAYLPALHREGINMVGVFKPLANDTAADKKVVVFTTYRSLQQFDGVTKQIQNNVTLEQAAPAYVNAIYNGPAYARYETILLEAFDKMPAPAAPKLSGDRAARVYELRSYEGPTEKLYASKVKMFNDGGEVGLFERLNFNAVFYASVLAGAHMPNLMYMTTFDNMADRDAHWKSFGEDAVWKDISGRTEYQNNVSKADIWLMTPTEYSDF